MHAVIGRVTIKPGREEETLAMIAEHGVAMLQGMTGAAGGYWARTTLEGELTQHSFWLFETEDGAGASPKYWRTPAGAWCGAPGDLRET